MTRQTLRLTLECENRCLFCAQVGLDSGEALAYAEIVERLRARREHGDAVTFTGGEPTRFRRLAELIAEARALGYRRIGLQTNGRALAEARRVAALCDAGLTDAHLSIHGPRALIHDYHTNVAGSFEAAIAAMTNLAARRVTAVVTTVLSRSNFRVLAAMPPLLRHHNAAAWLIRVPRAAGRARALEDRLIPRLAMAIPRVLHAVDLARRQGLPALIDGAPLCLLGPYATRGGVIIGDGLQAFPARCSGCVLRTRCPGFDPEYLARFHGDEASPRAAQRGRAASAGLSRREASLVEMFVGIGELHLGAVEPAAVQETLATRDAPEQELARDDGVVDVDADASAEVSDAEGGRPRPRGGTGRVSLPVVNS